MDRSAVRNSQRPASGWSCVRPGALADLLQRGEIVGVAGAQQPLVEEGLDVGQDDLAVGVVLDLA